MVAPLRRLLRPPSYNARHSLAFLHIPKTAGSSLIAALVQSLQPATVLSGFDTVLFGAFTNFASLDPTLSAQIHLPNAPLPSAPLVAGHMAYATLRQTAPATQIITILREPVSRLLSHWLFWRGHTDEHLAPWGAWADAVRLARRPLADFLAAPTLACQHDNLAVRMLLWPHKLIPNAGFIAPSSDRPLLAQALRRLNRLPFAGIVEDEDLAPKLSHFLARPLTIPAENRTAPLQAHLRGKLHEHLTKHAVARLQNLSRLDRVLWHTLVKTTCPHQDPLALQEETQARNVARFAALMAGG